MITYNKILTLAALVSAVSGTALRADDASTSLKIYTALEVEFATETGKLYQLQGSSNMVDWASIGDPVFGVGRPVTRVFSTRGGGEVAFGSYRLNVSDGPTNGLAPWSLAGLHLQLDDRAQGDSIRFLTETNGISPSESAHAFTYVFTRTDLNTVTADLQLEAEHRTLYTFTFTSASQGTWVREEFRKDRLKDRDVGVFQVVSPQAPPTDPSTPTAEVVLPTSLAGLSYVFQDGAHPDRLAFTSPTAGIESGDDVQDDEANAFTYTFAITGTNTAQLVVTFKNGKSEDYALTFTAGTQGRFVRQQFRDGRLKDTDRGSFSQVEGVPGDSNGGSNPPTDPNAAPAASVVGFTYAFRAGETPLQLVFSTDTTGTELGDDARDSEPNHFTYSYTVTGEHTAQLVVTLKPGRHQDYVLTFGASNAGTFVRQEFDRDALKDTDHGSFTSVATPKP